MGTALARGQAVKRKGRWRRLLQTFNPGSQSDEFPPEPTM